MKKSQIRFVGVLVLCAALFSSFLPILGQQQIVRARYDIKNYRIDAQILPASNQLKTVADVTLTLLDDTRSVTFELNGSMRVESVSLENKVVPVSSSVVTPTPTPTIAAPKGKPAMVKPTPKPIQPKANVTFIQDQTGVTDLGPSVKVDFGETLLNGTSVTLRFKYEGTLLTPEGGPLATKKLAFIGSDEGYLMYASRWFPFHDYAADRATSDITVSAPNGLNVIGYSDAPVSNAGGKFHFVQNKESLIGNLAYSRSAVKTLRYGSSELQFLTKIGTDKQVADYGETIGKAMEFYAKQYGQADCGNKIVIAQIDDESLDFYTGSGMIFIANSYFENRTASDERIEREVAFQWWGQTVGLKSFDDAWLSQGLAEYSAFDYRENNLKGAALDGLNRELLEKSLTFEQTASLARAPATLDDQSTAYQYIMYGKGAFAFKLLRETLGKQKFADLLRKFLLENRGKNASIDDFEKLSSIIAGTSLRYFFARWVEGTGVPEFTSDYQIIRTKAGKFVTRGTVKQNYDNLRLPVEVQLRAEGENENKTVLLKIDDASEDFNIETNGKPLEVIIDPNYKLLRISDDLKVSAIARRGIEQFKEGNYFEAQKQFEEALKLDRSNSWIYYHLGLLFLDQRNYDLAIDNFKAVEVLGLQGAARPSWVYVWSLIKMGNAYDAKGDTVRGPAAYNRAQKLGDNYANAQEIIKKYQGNPFDPKEKSDTPTPQ